MEVNANIVKELREKTGAGVMDCKKALAESKGDLEKAAVWLREKGIASAAKRAGRVDSFLVDGRSFTASELDKCNAAVKTEPAKALASQ